MGSPTALNWRRLMLALLLVGIAHAADDPALVALVKRADAIVAGTIREAKPSADGLLVKLQPQPDGHIKGLAVYDLWPILVPTGDDRPFLVGGYCVLCLKVDRAARRYVLLPEPLAKRELPEDVDALQELADRELPLVVTLGTEKDSYAVGEPVMLVWRFRNISDHPVSICLNERACQFFATDWPIGSGSYRITQPSDYRRLAPGEVYDLRRPWTVRRWGDAGPQPVVLRVGDNRLCMTYSVVDDSLHGPGGTPLPPLDDLVLVSAQRRLVVPARQPTAAERDVWLAKLAAPVWEDQRRAAEVLLGDPENLQQPAVQALLNHPWPRVRALVAPRYAAAADTLTPALLDRLYDSDRMVQQMVLMALATGEPVAGTLRPFYVLRAVLEDALDARLTCMGPLAGMAPQMIAQRLTPDLGEVIAARVAAGRDRAGLLDGLQPLEQRVLRAPTAPATLAETAEILKRWRARTEPVANSYPLAEFDADYARCRERMFPNLPFDELTEQVAAQLTRVGSGMPLGRPGQPLRPPPLARPLGPPPGWRPGQPVPPPDLLAGLRAFGPAVAGRVMTLQSQRPAQTADVPQLYELLAEWRAPGLFEWLLVRAYDGGFYAPSALLKLDPARAEIQLTALAACNEGAALVLAQRGDKRAVPWLLAHLGEAPRYWPTEELAALTALTGQTRTVAEWRAWRDAGGQ